MGVESARFLSWNWHRTSWFKGTMSEKIVALLLVLAASRVLAADAPPRDADVTAPDGTVLKATYYAAVKPGPGVLLLHMCNSNRKAWEPVGRQLSVAGIHALALDYRGF